MKKSKAKTQLWRQTECFCPKIKDKTGMCLLTNSATSKKNKERNSDWKERGKLSLFVDIITIYVQIANGIYTTATRTSK